MAGNPYRAWVETFVSALRTGEAIGPTAVRPKSPVATETPKALIFAPHPDDEIITGALPLRLMREQRFAVIDVAVTLGSRVDRREQRSIELQAACACIGFGLIHLGRTDLEGINLQARERDPAGWNAAVTAIADVLAAQQPDVVFLPHAADWNATHIGVHHLVVEAMRRLPGLACRVVETEYWGAMAAPNLMVEIDTGRRRGSGGGVVAARGRSRAERVSPAPAGLDDGQCAPRVGADWRPRRDGASICVRHALPAARLE